MSDVRDPDRDQVAPTPNKNPSCHDLVIEDMKERKEFGLRKYDSLLQPHNGRDFLRDIYEELLDATAYIRGRIEEEKDDARGIGVEEIAVESFLRLYRALADGNPPEGSALDDLLEGFQSTYDLLRKDEPVEVIGVTEPTEPGFYRYSGGAQNIFFLRSYQGNWYYVSDGASMDACDWSYIEQALGVWDLVKIEGDGS
jgi:hypothetical protein